MLTALQHLLTTKLYRNPSQCEDNVEVRMSESERRLYWCLSVCMCACHTSLHLSTSIACSSLEGKKRGSGAGSAERPLATMPAQSLQHFGTPVACCISFFPLCLSPFPPTRVYFCQLPYSCLHSVFARSHKTSLVRADEALPPTLGTPGEMVNRHTSFCRQALQLWGLRTRWSQTFLLSFFSTGMISIPVLALV